MNDEIYEATNALDLTVYRMLDGSMVFAEEVDQDLADGSITLSRPLMMYRLVLNNTLKSILIPWIEANDIHFQVEECNIITRAEATFNQKLAYAEYFVLQNIAISAGIIPEDKPAKPLNINQVITTGLDKKDFADYLHLKLFGLN